MTPQQEKILRAYARGVEQRHIAATVGATRAEVDEVVIVVCGYDRTHARHLVELLDRPTTPATATPPTPPAVTTAKFRDPPRRELPRRPDPRPADVPRAEVSAVVGEDDTDQVVTADRTPSAAVTTAPLAPTAIVAGPLLSYPAWWCPRPWCHRRQFDPGECRNCGGDLIAVRVEIHQVDESPEDDRA